MAFRNRTEYRRTFCGVLPACDRPAGSFEARTQRFPKRNSPQTLSIFALARSAQPSLFLKFVYGFFRRGLLAPI